MKKSNAISARQIKAARALLDWSQETLAENSGLSIATIRKIESGHISPRGTTNKKIQESIESAGLEFLEPYGIRQKPEDLSVYQGPEGVITFFDDVYQTARKEGGDLVVVALSEVPFIAALDDYLPFHLERMAALAPRTTVKCILMEDFDAAPADYCEYRSLSKAYVDSVPFYVYGNNYAIFLFNAEPSPKIIVHRSALLANAYRKQFYSMWDKAAIISQATFSEKTLKKKTKLS